MVPGRHCFIGRLCWVRSRAWICDFSSNDNAMAASGGFMYTPTTSISLSSNFGSIDTLKVLTRWGLSPRAFHSRTRRAYLHPWHGTDHAGDHLHRHHPPFKTHNVRRVSPQQIACRVVAVSAIRSPELGFS